MNIGEPHATPYSATAAHCAITADYILTGLAPAIGRRVSSQYVEVSPFSFRRRSQLSVTWTALLMTGWDCSGHNPSA